MSWLCKLAWVPILAFLLSGCAATPDACRPNIPLYVACSLPQIVACVGEHDLDVSEGEIRSYLETNCETSPERPGVFICPAGGAVAEGSREALIACIVTGLGACAPALCSATQAP